MNEYWIGALVLWAVISLPLGVLVGKFLNRMDNAPPSEEVSSEDMPTGRVR